MLYSRDAQFCMGGKCSGYFTWMSIIFFLGDFFFFDGFGMTELRMSCAEILYSIDK